MHERIELLLPWYVAGTLSGPEADEVRAHLELCTTCASQEAWLRRVAAAIRSGRGLEPSPRVVFETLGRIASWEASGPWWRRVWRVREARLLGGIAALQAVVLAAVAILWLTGPWGPEYRTLGSPKAPGGAEVVQVVFHPTAREAEIRALMQQVGATFVGGPGAGGVYRLRVTGDPDGVLRALRGSRLVQFAEREP